jgi:hypothetical protein
MLECGCLNLKETNAKVKYRGFIVETSAIKAHLSSQGIRFLASEHASD